MAEPTISNVTITPEAGEHGDTFTATVEYAGTEPVTIEYQWLWDGQPITGATSQTYTVPADGNVETFDPPAAPTGLQATIL